MKHILLAIFFSAIFLNIIAQTVGLQIGDKAPNFKALNQFGEGVELSKLLESGPVVLTFYRGEWCPYCNKYLTELDDNVSKMEMLEATLVAVSPEISTYTEKMANHMNNRYPIIADREYAIMKAFKVDFELDKKTRFKYRAFGINIKKHNGTADYILPVPATYVIAKNGTIAYRHFDENYKIRGDVEEILNVLNQLKNKREE